MQFDSRASFVSSAILNPQFTYTIFHTYAQNTVDAHHQKLNEMQGQQDIFDMQMATVVMAASSQQASFDSQMARAVMDASAKQIGFDSHMAKAALEASDQQASFNDQMARAVMDASDKQAGFDTHMARAVLAASDQQTDIDNQMSKSRRRSALAADDMKAAYEKMTSDNAADQKKVAAQVCTTYLIGVQNSVLHTSPCM